VAIRRSGGWKVLEWVILRLEVDKQKIRDTLTAAFFALTRHKIISVLRGGYKSTAFFSFRRVIFSVISSEIFFCHLLFNTTIVKPQNRTQAAYFALVRKHVLFVEAQERAWWSSAARVAWITFKAPFSQVNILVFKWTRKLGKKNVANTSTAAKRAIWIASVPRKNTIDVFFKLRENFSVEFIYWEFEIVKNEFLGCG